VRAAAGFQSDTVSFVRFQFVEVDLARRQYETMDPANRWVTRELERRFENALLGLEEIELKTQARMQKTVRPLTEEHNIP